MDSKKEQSCWTAGSEDFPYPVEYNDHFETPAAAYADIQPVLDFISRHHIGKTNKTTILYDPYYCNGQTKRLLHDIGYEAVIHDKRDFYADIANHTVPNHDIFITNPPYSDEHKIQCLAYCCTTMQSKQKQTPYFLLMPAYVATKQYLRHALADMIFLVPSTDYQYHHPEHTGKDQSPFTSLWFCGVGAARVDACLEQLPPHLRLARSLQELADDHNIIRLKNRLNPRQRKKRKQQGLLPLKSAETRAVSAATRDHPIQKDIDAKRNHQDNVAAATSATTTTRADNANKTNNGSKSRDATSGKRKRPRF